jgi:alpha-L-fucosidase
MRQPGLEAETVGVEHHAGAIGYITFVAKHHDGFCLWDSKATAFDSMDYPAHRDFLKELAGACAEAKMPLFIYYSFGIDWTHPDYLPRRLYVNARPDSADGRAMDATWTPEHFERYRQFCLAQLTELCSNYGPVAGFWFDPLGGVLANSELFKTEEIYAHIRRLQPQALILNKTGITGSEDVVVGERELSSISHHYPGKSPEIQRIRQLADAAWEKNRFKKAEIAVTSQGTWCWTPKSSCVPAPAMLKMLQGAARNNANLLLNMGLKPDGAIAADVEREFSALGELIDKDRDTWRQLRGGGEALDQNEAVKTAR